LASSASSTRKPKVGTDVAEWTLPHTFHIWYVATTYTGRYGSTMHVLLCVANRPVLHMIINVRTCIHKRHDSTSNRLHAIPTDSNDLVAASLATVQLNVQILYDSPETHCGQTLRYVQCARSRAASRVDLTNNITCWSGLSKSAGHGGQTTQPPKLAFLLVGCIVN